MPDQRKNAVEGFINLGGNPDDVVEPKPVRSGMYSLTIEGAEAIREGNNLVALRVRIGFDNVADAATMFHNISLPQPGDDEKKKNFKLLLIKKFIELFKIPHQGGQINTMDFAGCHCDNGRVELMSWNNHSDGNPLPEPRISNRLKLM